jgi:hypothetical protein
VISADDESARRLAAALRQEAPPARAPSPVRRYESPALVFKPPFEPAASNKEERAQRLERRRDRRGPVTNALTRWYKAMTDAHRQEYLGWAVIAPDGTRDRSLRCWSEACARADEIGGQVAMWASKANRRGGATPATGRGGSATIAADKAI